MTEELVNHPRFHEAYSIAVVCHEANRAWCSVNDDQSQKSWTEAEEWQRESAVKGVLFRMENPFSGKDAQHNAWMQDKIDNGWVYGEIKDPIQKTHPCIVPFDKLPDFQQKKDALFCAIVDSLTGSKSFAATVHESLKVLNRKTELTFGEAIEALKNGKRVAREGWNGKGMFIVLMPALYLPPYNTADTARKVNDRTAKWIGEDQPLDCQPYIAMYNAQKQWQPGWNASQADMLSEDWMILE